MNNSKIIVRPYRENDLQQLIKVYQSAFAEPPWNEYMKCSSCSVEYSKEEVETAKDFCKKCNSPLELVEFWGAEDVIQDLEFALSQTDSIVLVGENDNEVIGFTWGYKLPLEKFPFLIGKVKEKTSYIDEVAVRADKRRRGIATLLSKEYLRIIKQQKISEVILRTDERNIASMSLYKGLGFSDIPDPEASRGKVYDPEFPNRIYLRKFVNE